MTFLDDEALAQSSSPVELFEFTSPSTTYRYTSSEAPIVAFGNTFDATPTLRSTIEDKGDGNPTALAVTIPVNAQVAQDFAFSTPERGLRLTVFRYHPDTSNYSTYWSGPMTSIAVQKEVVIFRVPSELGSRIKVKLPRILYQPLCNNILYDTLCRVKESSNVENTTITSLSTPTEQTLTLASIGGQVDGWATGGYAQHSASGQKRMLIFQTGTVIKLLYPFKGALIGDAINVFAGCDHTLATCNEKFSNKIRFNGFSHMPSKGAGYKE